MLPRLRGQAALRAPATGRAERGGGRCAPTLTPCCARLEAPRDLRQGGARVLRVAQRPDARAELAGRPHSDPALKERVLLGL